MKKREPAAIVVTPEPAALKLTAHAPTIQVSSNLWITWSRIAIEHEAEAWKHRAEWKAGRLRNILPEFQASLITVTAVALAFDALHGALAPMLGRDSRHYQHRWVYLRDSFALACKPSRRWQNEFAWLLGEARVKAVHHGPKQHEPIWHEGLQTSIAEENHIFCAESSTRAVNLMMDVFGALLAPASKGKAAAIGGWSSGAAHVFDELTSLRTGPS